MIHRISSPEWNSLLVKSLQDDDYTTALHLAQSTLIVSQSTESTLEEIVTICKTKTKNPEKMMEFLIVPELSQRMSSEQMESIFLGHAKSRNTVFVSSMLKNGHFIKRISKESLNEMIQLYITKPFEGTRLIQSLLDSVAKQEISEANWGRLLLTLIEKGHDKSASLILKDSKILNMIPKDSLKSIIDRIVSQPFSGSVVSESFVSGPLSSHVPTEQWQIILKAFVKKLDYKAVSSILENESILDRIPIKERVALFKTILKLGSFTENLSEKALVILKSTLASAMSKSLKEGPQSYLSRTPYEVVQHVLPNGSTIGVLEMIQDSKSNEDSLLIQYKKLPDTSKGNNILTYRPQRIVPKPRPVPKKMNSKDLNTKNHIMTHPLPKGASLIPHGSSMMARMHL